MLASAFIVDVAQFVHLLNVVHVVLHGFLLARFRYQPSLQLFQFMLLFLRLLRHVELLDRLLVGLYLDLLLLCLNELLDLICVPICQNSTTLICNVH